LSPAAIRGGRKVREVNLRIAVTGAGGFVGSALIERLAASGRLGPDGAPISGIVAIDARLPAYGSALVTPLSGDISDPSFRANLLARPFDVLIHLAAIPGGGAATDYDLGWRVNVDAVIGLFDGLARQAKPARVVFSSSIGVFGAPLPADKVDDETYPVPTMSYGAQKLIGETLLADFSRRGLIDGLSLRLPGIVARPRQAGGHLSAYMSNIFHALAAGEAFTCPVSEQAQSWFMSRDRCVDNLIHAAVLPSPATGVRRSFNLPALRLSMAELVDGLAAQFGSHVRSLVSWQPNAQLEAQFGAYPPLLTPTADALGFRHDGDAATLVARALAPYRDKAQAA
jgi:nucleoside-diphosphate-sugar epimerase